MKRRTLCVLALILWELVFCTILSARIEQLMIPQVVLTQPDERDPSPHIAPDALFLDDAGTHLYRPADGSGWETGIRIYEENPENYTVGTDQINLKFYGDYIRYASKPLRDGDLISVQSQSKTQEDTWLVILSESTSPLSDRFTPFAEAENARLIKVSDAPQPFMSDRAKNMILSANDFISEDTGRVYSLFDVKCFLSQLPPLTFLFSASLFVMILWIYSFMLTKNAKRNRAKLIFHSILSILILLIIPMLVQRIALPSSLLPQYRITDISYYAKEFSEIFQNLGKLAAAGTEEAAVILSAADSARKSTFFILLAAPIAAAALITAECLFSKSHRQKHRFS